MTGVALAHCILCKFLRVVCHCFPPPLDVPTFAAKCLYVRNDARDPSSERLYFPSEGRRAEDFFAPKNPTASAGFEPANLGTKGQNATPRPPKPLRLCIMPNNYMFVTKHMLNLFHKSATIWIYIYYLYI